MSLFQKQEKPTSSSSLSTEVKRGHVISISNLSANDSVDGAIQLLTVLPRNSKKIIIEMPCLGIAKLAIALLNPTSLKEMSNEKTMDQLLLDYDRNENVNVKNYIYQAENTDFLLLNPRVSPDNPINRKLDSLQTSVELPVFLKKELSPEYDFIIMVTQGTLGSATTYFTLKIADANILHSAKAYDLPLNLLNYKQLHEKYKVAEERLFLFSTDRHLKLKATHKLYSKSKQIFKDIMLLDPLEPEEIDLEAIEKRIGDPSGFINPVDYINYQVDTTLLGQKEFTYQESDHLEKLAKRVRERLQVDHLDEFVASLMDPEARKKVQYYIADIIRNISDMQLPGGLDRVIAWVQKEITEMSVLQELFDDPEISNIDVNGPQRIMIEKNGVMQHAKHIQFESIDHIYRVINRMLSPMGKQLTGNTPSIDTVYYGTRICAVADTYKYSGLSSDSPLISIRKFPPGVFSDEQIVASGNQSQRMLEFFKFIVGSNANIIVGGSTNSGKTTLLLRLPLYLDSLTRIFTVEDSPELLLSSKLEYADYPNIVALQTKDIEDVSKSYGTGRVIRTTLRMSPNVYIIGEIRDDDGAKEALKAGNTGHVLLSSTHANSCEAAATRILQLNGNTEAAAAQISETIDIFVYQKRLKNGQRIITKIAELIGYEGVKNAVLNTIFIYDAKRKVHRQVGKLKTDYMRDKVYLQEWPEEEISRWCDFKDQMDEYGEEILDAVV